VGGYILNVGQLRGRCKQALHLRGCGVVWGLCVMQRKRACVNSSIMYQLRCSQGGVQVPTGGMWQHEPASAFGLKGQADQVQGLSRQ